MTAFTPSGKDASFVERRTNSADVPAGRERRQFANSYEALTPDARELAIAIDRYKVENRRRYITYEEMLAVIRGLGYAKHS